MFLGHLPPTSADQARDRSSLTACTSHQVACPLLLMWLATCCVLDCVGIMPPGRFLANLAKRGGWQVAVSVRNSTVAGLGVFVHDAHPEGTLLWRFDPDVGLSFGNSLADCMAIVESLGLTPEERTCDSEPLEPVPHSVCVCRVYRPIPHRRLLLCQT